jgi:hypothetical protein
MPMIHKNLGEILLHIYDFPFEAGIYLPDVTHYETNTPCIVAWAWKGEDEDSIHQACLTQGFKNWLNVAVVSDTCDGVSEQTGDCLVTAFNEDCREGGWLWKMMNYWNTDPSP